ncbi:hypothetical protein SAMN04489712_111104 [Thermomonospora echinospora]|uniref:Uncharacterized protein n=1 Tax=Thermomonospora echinospora TaxID=1992 RepID=A0A1H6CSM7_9ACTN|nr:hypothetical protein [Thermomonospora echinospora]SEG75974.1 hypothetical protein SAMN04489712_111104 [Thermomonospora echinospora]
MGTFRFRALVTIDPAAARTWDRSSAIRHLVIRVHRDEPERICFFDAVLSTDDQEPLVPGDTDHVVTMTLTDETALDVLAPGEHFELWGHGEAGHGVISRRVFL